MPRRYNNRGNALQELKRFDEALASYDKALALRPDYAEALLQSRQCAAGAEAFDEALASYDRRSRCDRTMRRRYNNRGNALQELKRSRRGAGELRQGARDQARLCRGLNNRGNALRELKRFDEALASYDKALALRPDYAEALNNRGNDCRN